MCYILIVSDEQERIKEDAVWSSAHYSRSIHLEQLATIRIARTRSRPLVCYTECYLVHWLRHSCSIVIKLGEDGLSAIRNISILYEFGNVHTLKCKKKLSYKSDINPKQDRQCTHKRNTETRSCNHCCSRKPISCTYYECLFVALMYAAFNARCAILPSVAPLALPHLFTLFHTGHKFSG